MKSANQRRRRWCVGGLCTAFIALVTAMVAAFVLPSPLKPYIGLPAFAIMGIAAWIGISNEPNVDERRYYHEQAQGFVRDYGELLAWTSANPSRLKLMSEQELNETARIVLINCAKAVLQYDGGGSAADVSDPMREFRWAHEVLTRLGIVPKAKYQTYFDQARRQLEAELAA